MISILFLFFDVCNGRKQKKGQRDSQNMSFGLGRVRREAGRRFRVGMTSAEMKGGAVMADDVL